MKAVQLWLLIVATALLTACATQREAPPRPEDTAPSEQAMQEEAAPPEAPPAEAEQPAMEEEAAGPTTAPPEEVPPEQDESVAALEPEPGEPMREAPPAEEPAAEPIVPAFPERERNVSIDALETVHFPFDSSDLTDEARRALDRNVSWLMEHPQVRVRVEGHCDERGTSEYNLALGQRRARSVRDYLVDAGIDPARLVTVSYGEEVPLVREHTEEAYRLNRRAEFSRADG